MWLPIVVKHEILLPQTTISVTLPSQQLALITLQTLHNSQYMSTPRTAGAQLLLAMGVVRDRSRTSFEVDADCVPL
jgi:ABC-type Fe2+-enterobactin transport system substrate-binding protein